MSEWYGPSGRIQFESALIGHSPAVATNFVPLENAQDKDRVIKAAIGAVLGGARLDAIAGLARHLEILTEPDSKPAGNLGRSVVLLTREGAEKVVERIRELDEEMTEFEDRDGQEYAFSFVFFPMVGPVKGERP